MVRVSTTATYFFSTLLADSATTIPETERLRMGDASWVPTEADTSLVQHPAPWTSPHRERVTKAVGRDKEKEYRHRVESSQMSDTGRVTTICVRWPTIRVHGIDLPPPIRGVIREGGGAQKKVVVTAMQSGFGTSSSNQWHHHTETFQRHTLIPL